MSSDPTHHTSTQHNNASNPTLLILILVFSRSDFVSSYHIISLSVNCVFINSILIALAATCLPSAEKRLLLLLVLCFSCTFQSPQINSGFWRNGSCFSFCGSRPHFSSQRIFLSLSSQNAFSPLSPPTQCNCNCFRFASLSSSFIFLGFVTYPR